MGKFSPSPHLPISPSPHLPHLHLESYAFECNLVLPGHGRRYHGTVAKTKQQMQQCIEWMKQQQEK